MLLYATVLHSSRIVITGDSISRQSTEAALCNLVEFGARIVAVRHAAKKPEHSDEYNRYKRRRKLRAAPG